MKKLTLYTIFNLLTYLIFCILTTFSHAQDNEGVSEENAEIKQHFPITVIDMQYIVRKIIESYGLKMSSTNHVNLGSYIISHNLNK